MVLNTPMLNVVVMVILVVALILYCSQKQWVNLHSFLLVCIFSS